MKTHLAIYMECSRCGAWRDVPQFSDLLFAKTKENNFWGCPGCRIYSWQPWDDARVVVIPDRCEAFLYNLATAPGVPNTDVRPLLEPLL